MVFRLGLLASELLLEPVLKTIIVYKPHRPIAVARIQKWIFHGLFIAPTYFALNWLLVVFGVKQAMHRTLTTAVNVAIIKVAFEL